MNTPASFIICACLLVSSRLAADADTVFSSYPQNSNPTLSVNQANTVGVSFTPTDTNFQLSGLVAPLTFIGDPPGSTPQPVIFELWSSHLVDIGSGVIRQRPDSLLGSWGTSPVPASGFSTFSDVQVNITAGPVLTENSTYWFLIRAGWSALGPNTHVRWAGSIPYNGYGYGERMIVIGAGNHSPTGDNQDPGDLLAFQVTGTPVPEQSTALMVAVGMVLLFCCHRKRLTKRCSEPSTSL